jgi:hypothetical protein
MLSHFIRHSLPRKLLRSVFLVALLLLGGRSGQCRADDSSALPRQIFICSSSQVSASLRKSIDEFTAQAGQVPLLKALVDQKEAVGIVAQESEALMPDKSYGTAAHNHLVVIGLQSQDPLLVKVWGYEATINEKDKSVYSEGWGYMQGDIGWVESDRNPFLHSRRIASAPEDTVLVKITGTSEAGVLAALQAFQGGMINGFVVAGPLTRPKTTLLDLDPLATPAPGTVPGQVKIGDGTAELVGWNQIPEQEYRAVLESGGVEPKKMWRYKDLASGILEQSGIVRWLGGLNRMAYGNAIDVIECESADEATAAAEKMSGMRFKDLAFKTVSLSSSQPAWVCPMPADEAATDSPGNVIVTSSGPYLFLSSLPEEGTSAFITGVVGQSPP